MFGKQTQYYLKKHHALTLAHLAVEFLGCPWIGAVLLRLSTIAGVMALLRNSTATKIFWWA